MLTAPLRYQSARLGYTIIVPPGFSTDLASIPWLVQPLLPRVGRWDRAAVVHDRLYDGSMRTHWRPRSLCDAVFREAMAVDGVTWLPRYLIWAGVRLFGFYAWYKDASSGN